MSLLASGESQAYAPIRGPFSEFLTLSGSDKHPRVNGLDLLTGIVSDMFRERSFHFERDTRATRVTTSQSGAFRVEARRGGESLEFESDKLVLALGHTMKEVSCELRHHVILGAGELCRRLANELPLAGSKEGALDRLLAQYKRFNGETVRIGLVGLGASMIEVVKIFETLLGKPDEVDHRYRTQGSGIPVELVIYDHHSRIDGSLFDGFRRNLRQLLSVSPEVDMLPESREFNEVAEARFVNFAKSAQIRVVPDWINWSRVVLSDGFVIPKTEPASNSEVLSVIIDCAPFMEGIDQQQKEVIEDLDMVKFDQIEPSRWRAPQVDPAWKRRLAFVGACALPRGQWSIPSIEAQVKQIVEDFYSAQPQS
jgi:hypothetical protein